LKRWVSTNGRIQELKQANKFISVFMMLLCVAAAQETRIFRDGGNWTREVTGNLAAVRNLRVKTDAGAVRVEGGGPNQISYVIRNRSNSSSEERARREFEQFKIKTYVNGDTAWIVGEWEEGGSRRFSGDFRLTVPQNIASVKVETEGGNVDAYRLGGRLEASSGGGTIRIEEIAGATMVETGGGNISARSLGGDASLHTGGGSIRVESTNGKLTAESGGGSITVTSCGQGAVLETGGGSISVERCGGHVKATTGGGSIDLGQISGPAEIETGGGSIRLTSATGAVHAETGGGSIELNGVPCARAETGAGGIVAKFVPGNQRTDSMLETAAGDVTIYLASNLNVTVRADIELANGHSIHSDFSEIRVNSEGGDWPGPKSVTAEGSLNGGGPLVKIRTVTGNISIRRVP
jgi:DUF4097 and DUF4098 domain-containing protein YvlB